MATATLWPSIVAGLLQVKDAEPHFSHHDVTLINSLPHKFLFQQNLFGS